MASKFVLGNFSTILSAAKTILAQTKPVSDPFLGATSIDVFKDTVADGRRLLPGRYQQRYVDVLEQVVQQAQDALSTIHPRDGRSRREVFEELQVVFSIAAAPIVQLKSREHQRELKAFLIEISNIYRRFINDKQVSLGARIHILSPDLDPLGAFGHDLAGPFTLQASQDMPVAIVSKPANEMHFLPLWAADGHEVGGHDIYGAVLGFQPDLEKALEANIRAAFRSGRVKTSVNHVVVPVKRSWFWGNTKKLSMEDFMVQVWKAWLSEASADHAGLLNLGPMYLDSLILLLCTARDGGQLSARGVFDAKLFPAAGGFEEHPIDVLRCLLMLEAIKLLKFSDGAAYVQAFAGRIKSVCGGALPATVHWTDRKQSRVLDIAVSDFQAVLPVVAETVLQAKLPSLANQSFGGIINWLDSDERIVAEVAQKLLQASTDVAIEVEPRHVVAASMQALERASNMYGNAVLSARTIHNTGATILQNMYDAECLLCVGAPAAKTPAVDLKRLFKHIKG